MGKRYSVAIALGVVVSALAATAAAEPSRQFDLICGPTPDARYLIDLDTHQWCQPGFCDASQREALTDTPDELVLRDRQEGCVEYDTGLCHIRITVGRRSAIMTASKYVPEQPITDQLERNLSALHGLPLTRPPETIASRRQCQLAPYTGPTAKPQF